MPCVNSLFGMNDQLTEYFWHLLRFRIDFYAIQILLAGWFITHQVKGEPHVCLFMLSYERCIFQSWLNRNKCFCSHFYLSEINSCLFTSFVLVWLFWCWWHVVPVSISGYYDYHNNECWLFIVASIQETVIICQFHSNR